MTLAILLSNPLLYVQYDYVHAETAMLTMVIQYTRDNPTSGSSTLASTEFNKNLKHECQIFLIFINFKESIKVI